VPAEVAHGEPLVAAGLDQRAGVPRMTGTTSARSADDGPVGRRRRRRGRGTARAAQAAAADDDAVAAGLGHHAQGVLGGPDVAVAEHRDGGEGLLERRDGGPVGPAGVELLGRAGVQGDGRGALVLRPATGLEVGDVLGVDAEAHLHGHRHGAGGPHGGADEVAEQHRVGRQGRSPAPAGDLRATGSRR
jgi:hypothetical protein